jgi:hypothetical protein
MNYHAPQKTKRDWEKEILECLESARQEVTNATGAKRDAALERYRIAMAQFTDLILHGAVPPEEPCYMETAAESSAGT